MIIVFKLNSKLWPHFGIAINEVFEGFLEWTQIEVVRRLGLFGVFKRFSVSLELRLLLLLQFRFGSHLSCSTLIVLFFAKIWEVAFSIHIALWKPKHLKSVKQELLSALDIGAQIWVISWMIKEVIRRLSHLELLEPFRHHFFCFWALDVLGLFFIKGILINKQLSLSLQRSPSDGSCSIPRTQLFEKWCYTS